MIYPAISIRQPWAWAILNAGKDVENRTWPLPQKYQNTPVLIHAGKTVDEDAVDFLTCLGVILSGRPPVEEAYPKGGIVGALVFSGMPQSKSAWAEEGLCHWHIQKCLQVPFHPCRGQLGFFQVDYPHDIGPLK